jgi:hypothetical protein
MYRYTVQRSSPTSTLKLEASYVFRLFPMHQNANRARSSGAAAKRSASSSCSRKTGYYFNFYLFQSLCIARNCSRATSDSRYSKGRRGRSRRHPLRDKFLVQPVTAVVSPPNLSAHKSAGNCTSRDDDRPQMPSPCRCGALAQSKAEADRYHRGLWFQSTRFIYWPYRPSWLRS